MYRRILNILALCVLAAAAAGTWYWGRPIVPEATTAEGVDDRPPSYYLRDAVIRRTDDAGRVLYRIYAEFAEERPEERALSLDGVRIEYRESEQIPWQIQAGSALVFFDEQTVELAGGVELTRDIDASGVPVKLHTEQVRLDAEQRVVTADGDVSFAQGESGLTAVGLIVLLQEDRVELKSNVRGRFSR